MPPKKEKYLQIIDAKEAKWQDENNITFLNHFKMGSLFQVLVRNHNSTNFRKI